MAQLAEHSLSKGKVGSSNLPGGCVKSYTVKGYWSRGMILDLGARGRRFKSGIAPFLPSECLSHS